MVNGYAKFVFEIVGVPVWLGFDELNHLWLRPSFVASIESGFAVVFME